MDLENKRFPIGKFEYGKTYTTEETRGHIKSISNLPKKINKVIKKMSNDDFDTPYRKGGWTVRQVINHLSDSHINAYIRTKLMVTETHPVIKPYAEALWAETMDGKYGDVGTSLNLLKYVHKRWTDFLESLVEEDFQKTYYHPGYSRSFTLAEALALYAWHGKHHLGHIKLVAKPKDKKKGKKHKKELVIEHAEKTAITPAIAVTNQSDAVVIIPASRLVVTSEAAPTEKKTVHPSTGLVKKESTTPPETTQVEAPAVKTRSRRRTKEEIEADKAAKALLPKKKPGRKPQTDATGEILTEKTVTTKKTPTSLTKKAAPTKTKSTAATTTKKTATTRAPKATTPKTKSPASTVKKTRTTTKKTTDKDTE